MCHHKTFVVVLLFLAGLHVSCPAPSELLRQKRDDFWKSLPVGNWFGGGNNFGFGFQNDSFQAAGNGGLNLFGNNVYGKQEGIKVNPNSGLEYRGQGNVWNSLFGSNSDVKVDWAPASWFKWN